MLSAACTEAIRSLVTPRPPFRPSAAPSTPARADLPCCWITRRGAMIPFTDLSGPAPSSFRATRKMRRSGVILASVAAFLVLRGAESRLFGVHSTQQVTGNPHLLPLTLLTNSTNQAWHSLSLGLTASTSFCSMRCGILERSGFAFFLTHFAPSLPHDLIAAGAYAEGAS